MTPSVPDEEKFLTVSIAGAAADEPVRTMPCPPKSAVSAVTEPRPRTRRSLPRVRRLPAVRVPVPETLPAAVRLSAATLPVTEALSRTASFALKFPAMSAVFA